MDIQIHCRLSGLVEYVVESLDTPLVVGIVFFGEYIVMIHYKGEGIGIVWGSEWLCEMDKRNRHFTVIRIGNDGFVTNECGGPVKLIMLCNRVVIGIIIGNVFNEIAEIGFQTVLDDWKSRY